jgi:transcriptional regulator with XRE-family HTH domain
MRNLGKNIRRLRELRNFTQQYIADKLQMTQGNYARIENGEIQLSEKRLESIAELLGYSVDFIVQFDVEKIHDLMYEKKEPKTEMMQLQISPDLKNLYESRINVLEKYVNELESELKLLKELKNLTQQPSNNY